jgi:hypothetical protein
LRGFDLPGSVNRFSQSRGHFSVRPPNSSMSFREILRDVHVISSCSRLCPGFATITSLPRDRACKMFSCALSQSGSASLRHRYIQRDAGNPACESARSDGLQSAAGAIWRSPLLETTQTRLSVSRHRRSYFFSGVFSPFIVAIFCARPAANFSY